MHYYGLIASVLCTALSISHLHASFRYPQYQQLSGYDTSSRKSSLYDSDDERIESTAVPIVESNRSTVLIEQDIQTALGAVLQEYGLPNTAIQYIETETPQHMLLQRTLYAPKGYGCRLFVSRQFIQGLYEHVQSLYAEDLVHKVFMYALSVALSAECIRRSSVMRLGHTCIRCVAPSAVCASLSGCVGLVGAGCLALTAFANPMQADMCCLSMWLCARDAQRDLEAAPSAEMTFEQYGRASHPFASRSWCCDDMCKLCVDLDQTLVTDTSSHRWIETVKKHEWREGLRVLLSYDKKACDQQPQEHIDRVQGGVQQNERYSIWSHLTTLQKAWTALCCLPTRMRKPGLYTTLSRYISFESYDAQADGDFAYQVARADDV